MKEYLMNFLKTTSTYAIRLVVAAIILGLGWFLIGKLTKRIEKNKKLKEKDVTLTTFISSGTNIGLKVLLIVICVAIVGVPTASIIAIIGSAGLAIGLALQGGLSNIAGGVMLLIFRPFKAGDFISSGDKSGTVTGINIFYTTLLTPDNRKIYLPNGTLSNSSLVNVTSEDTRRVDFAYTIAFDSDLDKAKKVMKLVAGSESKVFKDPAPVVVVNEYGDGAYKVALRVWCATEDYWDVFASIQDKIQPAFEASGIVLGHPHLNVHLDK